MMWSVLGRLHLRCSWESRWRSMEKARSETCIADLSIGSWSFQKQTWTRFPMMGAWSAKKAVIFNSQTIFWLPTVCQSLNQALGDHNECLFPQLIRCLVGKENAELSTVDPRTTWKLQVLLLHAVEYLSITVKSDLLICSFSILEVLLPWIQPTSDHVLL